MIYATSYHMDHNRTTPRLLCDEFPNCPSCANSPNAILLKSIRLKLLDNVRRHFKIYGGDVVWIEIPRGSCPYCRCVIRILPDFLAPFKHYRADDMSGYLDGKKDSIDVLHPTDWTIANWDKWLSINHEELAGFGIDEMRAAGIPENWIGAILTEALNKGKTLVTRRKEKTLQG